MDVVSKSTLALNGGTPVRPADKPWPQWPMIEEEERAAVAKVLETRQWWYGEEVKRFEERYAAYQDAKHCITTTSGTTAIELMLLCYRQGLTPGRDIAIVGQGNEVVGARMNPALSTIDYCGEEIGDRAMEIGLQRVSKARQDSPQSTRVPPVLIARGSSQLSQ